MHHRPVCSTSRLNRRTALRSAGALAAALGLGSRLPGRATAQDATPTDLTGHPLVGTWLVWSPPPPTMNLGGLSPSIFAPDGSVVLEWAVSYLDPALPALDVVFNTPGIGTWEPIGERKGHFTVVAVLSDAKGTLLGSATIEGYPLVSADGLTFTDTEPEGRVTVRDAANRVVADHSGVAAGVTATRMRPSSVVFPAATPGTATPAA